MVWRDWPDWSDDSEVSTGGTRLDRRRKTAVPCAFGLWLLVNMNQVDAASAATCSTQRVKDMCPGAAHGNGEVADNEVASHPLSANLSQEICAENPNLATLVSEVTAVAKEAVAIPGELLDEALQTLRRVGSRSTAAGEP